MELSQKLFFVNLHSTCMLFYSLYALRTLQYYVLRRFQCYIVWANNVVDEH